MTRSNYSRIVLCLITVTFINISYAQREEPVIVKVTYQFSHIYDTTKRNQPEKAETMLLQGKSMSVYASARSLSETLSYQKREAEAKKHPITRASGGGVMAVGSPMAIVSADPMQDAKYYRFPAEKKLALIQYLMMSRYIVQNDAPVMDWKIGNEVKQVGGYNCQKATGELAGRTYTAWFTLDLPFAGGPWKLGGLPGLILSAYDEKHEVAFIFKKLERGEPDEMIVFENPDLFAKVSEAALNKLQRSYLQDPAAAFRSQLSNYSGTIETYFKDTSGKLLSGEEAKMAIREEARKQVNNPIELKKN